MPKHFPSAVLAAALCAAVYPAAAATDASRDEAAVIVTANRFGEPAERIPFGVTVIGASEIARSTATTLPEALAKLAGVHVRNNSGSPDWQVDLRGFGLTGDQNTLILVDGQRLSENELIPAHLTGIPLDAVDHIEILHGSGAVLYGGGATAGAINIVTRKAAPLQHSATVSAAIGNNGARDLRAGVFQAGDSVALTVHAGSFASDNYRQNNHVDQDNMEGDLRYFGRTGDIGLRFGSSREQLGLPGTRTEAEIASDPRGTDTPNDHSSTNTWHAGLGGRAQLAFGDFAVDFDYRNKKATAEFFSFGDFKIATNTNRWSLTPRLRVSHPTPGGEGQLLVGIDVERWDYTQVNTFGSATSHQNIDAFYFQDRVPLRSDIQFSVGARRQRIEDAFPQRDSFATSQSVSAFEVGLRHDMAAAWAFYGKWGQSFRVATVDENFDALSNTAVILAPQKSYDSELGVEYGTGRNRLRAALFDSHLTNEIHFLKIVGGNDFGFGRNINLPPTRRTGLELEGRTRPADDLDLGATYRYTRAEFRSGTFDGVNLAGHEVPQVPRNLLTANAAWRIAPGRQLAATLRYVGEQRYDNDQINTFRKMPAYELVDLKYRHDLSQWSWSLAIDNLFYKRYYSYAIRNDAGTSFSAYPELGRRVLFVVNVRL